MIQEQIHTITKQMNCLTMTPEKCSDSIITNLNTLGLKLKADNSTDIVNGGVTIDHGYGHFTNGVYIPTNKIERKHTIKINIYTKDQLPTEQHQTTLKKPSKIPTLEEIKKTL